LAKRNRSRENDSVKINEETTLSFILIKTLEKPSNSLNHKK